MNDDLFWAKVDRSSEAGCWPWLGNVNAGGRGRWRNAYAYRVAWELEHGVPVPEGLMVCHACDNPICVRPSHLFAGTAKDNMQDALSKGRLRLPTPRRGLAQHSATVAPEAIAEAVAEYLRGGVSQAEMGRRLGVSQTAFGSWVRAELRRDSAVAGVSVGKGRKSLAWGLKPCGTYAAYTRHHRENTPVCDPCREARRQYLSAYKAKRRLRSAS